MKKSMSLLHIFFILFIYYLTDSFASEISGIVYQKINAYILSCIVLDSALYIVSILLAIVLYTHYILKSTLQKYYIDKPVLNTKWYVAAFAMPLLLCLFYFLFMEGKFYRESLSDINFAYAVFYTLIDEGVCVAVVDGVVFTGVLLGVLQDAWGRKRAVFFSGLLFMLTHLESVDSSGVDQILLMICAIMTAGIALAMVTIGSGSIWPSVVIHCLYNILSGDGLILHINTFRNPWAIWNYVFESDNWLLTGISGVSELETGLPAMIGFAVIAGMAAWSIRKREMGIQRENNEI